MRFQITAPLAVFAGMAAAAPSAPTGDKVTVYDGSFFSGSKASWSIDNKCHPIEDEASKLKALTSVAVSGEIVCYLHDEADCEGARLDIHSPGVPDLKMLMGWAKRAKSMKCGAADGNKSEDKTEDTDE